MNNLTWKTKLILAGVILLLLAGLLLIIKYQHDLLKKQDEISSSLVEQKQLADNIVRAQAQYLTKKDLEKFAKDVDIKLDPIKRDLDNFDAKIEGISYLSVISIGSSETKLPSNNTIPKPPDEPGVDPKNPDPFKYMSNTQVLNLSEPFSDKSVPWGQVKFSAWRKNPWDLDVYEREYTVVNVLGVDENDRHYVYSKFSIETNGKKYDLKINEAKFVEEYPSSSFRFNPALFLGLDGGVYLKNPDWEVTPNLQMALFSYGRTKRTSDWTFLGVGAGYQINNDTFSLMMSPVNYNVGQHLPLVNNIFVGPSLSYDFKSNFSVSLGMRVGL